MKACEVLGNIHTQAVGRSTIVRRTMNVKVMMALGASLRCSDGLAISIGTLHHQQLGKELPRYEQRAQVSIARS